MNARTLLLPTAAVRPRAGGPRPRPTGSDDTEDPDASTVGRSGAGPDDRPAASGRSDVQAVVQACFRATVVVADDNDAFRGGIVRALRRRGDVDLLADVVDGTAALAAARELRPAVLVVDDRMPGMTGPEVARAVAADPALPGTVVVLLTGRCDEAMLEEARASGAVACLDKAASRREICAAIHAAAGQGTAGGAAPGR